MAAALLTAGSALLPATAETMEDATILRSSSWKTSPINKRFGITVQDAETAGYNVAFVTYLARFLLSFDRECQRWWLTQALPPRSSSTTMAAVNEWRLQQFAAFSASVEVGLQDYVDADGPSRLLRRLLARYCRTATPETTLNDENSQKQQQTNREIKEARRQLAILFALLTDRQPVKDLTKLLAAIDNGSISAVQMLDSNKSIDTVLTPGDELPLVEFPPPGAGDAYETAQGRVILQATGRFLRIDVEDGGAGYSVAKGTPPPAVTISAPQSGGQVATAKAKVVAQGPNQGTIESIQLVNSGSGYTNQDQIVVSIEPPPEAEESRRAIVAPVLEQYVQGIEVTKPGSGYAVEKPLKVYLRKPGDKEERILIGTATPFAEKSSYSRFRTDADTNSIREFEDKLKNRYISGAQSGAGTSSPPLPFWAKESTSSKLLSLVKDGVGLEYDSKLKRYVLAVDSSFQDKYPGWQQSFSNRPLDPQFGPRGRSPIERSKELDLSTYLRFVLSGAICASGVHLVLTPLDVVKTKVQTSPTKYPSVLESFGTVYREESFSTFFAGWIPTVVGNFFLGGLVYGLTEILRRNLIEVAGADASRLEVPIILAAAGVASFVGAFVACPFEAVRIRQVAQPDFAPRVGGVIERMYEEEGIGSFVNAIPVFLVKNVPYAMVKFTVFDLSTERLYEAYPAANEDLKLSLIISLVGGVLGGTAAALISNPADAVISELKKAKSDMSPQEAVKVLLERAGVSSLFKGLPLRMVFYSLLASMQFLVYDSVRFALGIGNDDLKLYLDVLGGALRETGGLV